MGLNCGFRIADCGFNMGNEKKFHNPQSAIRNPQSLRFGKLLAGRFGL
jgi:hypothetical protein